MGVNRVETMKNPLKITAWALVIVSVFFIVVNGLIGEHGYPIGPQFGDSEQFAEIFQLIIHSDSATWFHVAFAIDFIWAPLLLFTFFLVLTRRLKIAKPWWYVALSFVALFFDFYENIMYLAGDNDMGLSLATVEKLKILAYLLVLAAFTGYFILFLKGRGMQVLHFLKEIVRFLKSAYVSLFIVVLIFALMTQLGQGITIIVDLFYRPLNVFIFYVYIFFAALVLSYYPTYIEAFRLEQGKVVWCIKPFIVPVKWLGIGIITYKECNEDGHQNKSENQAQKKYYVDANYLRHYIGLLVLSAMVYLLVFAGSRIFMGLSLGPLVALLVFGFSIYIYIRSDKNNWATTYFPIVSIVTAVLVFVSIALVVVWRWTWFNLIITFITLLAIMFFYILFRQRRKEMFKKKEETFMMGTAIAGLLSLALLLISVFHIDFAVKHINPIIILLFFLVNLYGLIMILVKHWFFYDDDQACNDLSVAVRKRFGFYRQLIPATVLFLILWGFVAPRFPNDLHTLQTCYPSVDDIDMNAFVDTLKDNMKNASQVHFQVASYGGGLKANLWTLLVLNKLQDTTDGQFTRRTISMSGTSGGMQGIGNYAILWSGYYDKPHATDSLWSKIREIGEFNHLSIDLTYLLANDLAREFVPIEGHFGKDRSAKSMEYYAAKAGLSEADKKLSFRTVWSNVFRCTRYYPALIVNTYATRGYQGVGLSVVHQDFEFPGAINILDNDVERKQPGYYQALSTSNRFPIFSPTAHIRYKGHFLDGGYFDNSGLSSSRFFAEKICVAFENPIHYIVIDNSKVNYIKHVFRKAGFKYTDENSVGELSAIITGITGIDKIPNYFEGLLKEPTHIYLPQPFTYSDVMAAFDGQPRGKPEQIRRILASENAKIDSALKRYEEYKQHLWGTVSPPLARLNSTPAVIYQEAMIHCHEDVLTQIGEIKILINME